MIEDKKGQLKIQQMIFMLVAVALFFIFVALFFFAIKGASLYKQSIENERDKAAGVVLKIASSPEFSYEGVPNGVDEDKLMALRSHREYSDYWGIDGIIVRKLYPETSGQECEIGNYPDCNEIKIFAKDDNVAQAASAYVPLCRKEISGGRTYDKCEIAIVIIQTEEEVI